MILINLLPHREAARKQRRDLFNVSMGLAFLLGGGLLYSIPPRCTWDDAGFLSLCGLTQQIGGLSMMGAGAVQAGLGVIVVGAGGYYQRSARE